MPNLVVYRVSFSGDGLPTDDERELSSRGVWYEGSKSRLGQPWRHWGLVHADSRAEAARLMRDAVSRYGNFSDFSAEPVRDSEGALWRGGFHRRWDEIDWESVRRRVALSDAHAAAMYALADAAEPTELVRREVGLTRAAVESALRELCDKGLVERHTAQFFHDDYENDHEDWWRLTHAAWDLLGFIKSRRYH